MFEKSHNPFHDDFNRSALHHDVEGLTKLETASIEDLNLAQTSLAALVINSIHKDVLKYLRSTFDQINLSYEDIILCTIAALNRACIISKSIEPDEFTTYESRLKKKVASSDPSLGNIDAAGALENQIDGCHILLNYLRHFKDQIPPVDKKKQPSITSVEFQIRQSIVSTFHYVLKASYEDSVWNEGYITYDKEKKRLEMLFNNPDNLKVHRVGILRLERNSFVIFTSAIELINTNNQIRSLFANKFKMEDVRIINTRVSQGYLKYKLSTGNDPSEDYIELAIDSSLQLYYSYLEDIELPNLKGYTVRKLIDVFKILMQLFIKAARIHVENTGVKKKTEFYRYPSRIKRESLFSYMKRRSILSNEEINIFLEFLTSDVRINLWSNPLLKMGEDFYFALLPLTQGNILRLTDNWLEQGGIDLDVRGGPFESSVSSTMREIFLQKGYEFVIPSRKKFESIDGKREQIDFILSLKNLVIIAEVKCIKFPFEPRETHNALGRLRKGAIQAKRKAEFIEERRKEFDKELQLESKAILPIVITNYPLYTGHVIENVSIADFLLIESYFSAGALMKGKTTIDHGVFESEIVGEHKFYETEDECSNNFSDFLVTSLTIKEIEDSLEIRTSKISLDFFNYEILVQTAHWRDDGDSAQSDNL